MLYVLCFFTIRRYLCIEKVEHAHTALFRMRKQKSLPIISYTYYIKTYYKSEVQLKFLNSIINNSFFKVPKNSFTRLLFINSAATS